MAENRGPDIQAPIANVADTRLGPAEIHDIECILALSILVARPEEELVFGLIGGQEVDQTGGAERATGFRQVELQIESGWHNECCR